MDLAKQCDDIMWTRLCADEFGTGETGCSKSGKGGN